jgi:hypothetical protein
MSCAGASLAAAPLFMYTVLYRFPAIFRRPAVLPAAPGQAFEHTAGGHDLEGTQMNASLPASATIIILPSVGAAHHDTSPSECEPMIPEWDSVRPPRGGKPRLVCDRGRIITNEDLHTASDQERK